MLKRSFYLSFAFLIGLWVLILSNFVILDSDDYEEFEKMMEPVVRIHSDSTYYTKKAQQRRKGVQKDIWHSEGRQRHHLQLKSEHSELDLAQRKQKVDVIEHFQTVFCTIEEGEDIRHFVAQKGAYEFPAHRLWADEVQMRFHKSYEQDIPYFRGDADKVSFTMDQVKLSFKAEHLRARIDLERLPH